jgi:serine/threonine protein kinase/Tfp pilus assembly protein PilF
MSSQGGNPVDATIVGPVTGTMTSFADGEAVPAIEGYTLGRCIGRGGMGVVYEGHQLATDRRVAIKFLLDVAGNSESIRTRFEREVAVVVRLEHEGIVRVIDSGVKRGSYYYVMEYVEGQGLDDALPPGKADIKHTVAMIASVCDAVDYAHQRGVLHRDLKPGNVIVDAKTRPRLLDFGVAKTLDDPTTTASAREKYNITGQGQIVGTVAYMSPEQAAGDANMASMRSDVYSLGAMLYELLAGRLPIETVGSLRDILTAIAEKDPSPPSTYRKQIPKDLDAIVLKALEKKPALRYATAGEFAADLRRFLAHEPVTARRLSAAGRTWRWCVRNKTLATTIATATVLLVSTSTTLIVNLVEQVKIATTERDRANANAAKAVSGRDSLANVFRSVRGDEQGDVTVSKLLDTASASMEKNPPTSPDTEAFTREVFGSVYTRLGNYKQSEAMLRRALAIRETQEPRDPKALADCLHELGASLYWQGRYKTASSFYRRSLQLRRETISGDHRDIALSLTHLGACYLAIGDHNEAHDLYTQALEMRKRMYGSEHEEIAQSLNNLAKSYMEAEDYARAEALFRQSLALIIKLRGEQFGGTASVLQNLAKCMLEKGDTVGATAMFDRSLTVRRALFPKGHPSIAATLAGMSRAALAAGDLDGALSRADEAVALSERIKGAAVLPETGESYAARGAAHFAKGDATAALADFARARDVLLQVDPAPEFDLALAHLDVAVAAKRAGSVIPQPATQPDEAAGPGVSDDVPLTIATSLATMQLYRSASSRVMTQAVERIRSAGIDPSALPAVQLAPRDE